MSKIDSNEVLEEDKKKQPGFFPKLILLGILPLLYTIGLGMVILHFSGVSFHKQIRWVEDISKPLFAKMHTLAKTEAVKTTKEAAKTSVASSSNDKTETDTGKKTQETTQGATQESPAQENNTPTEVNTEKPPEKSVVADSLANMDPKDAAKLLSNMPEAEAVKNIKLLDPDIQTAIMAEMPAEEGAALAMALDKGVETATTTNSSLQLYQHMTPDQIAAILKGISDRGEVLKQIRQLDPKTASKVISQLDPKVAGWIVSQMN